MESWDDSPEERASYRDSEQFDEDSLSLCSWFSENERIGGLTWRGWKRNVSLQQQRGQSCEVSKLLDLSAKVVAAWYPFQAVEEYQPPVPEQVQMKIAYWSFPQKEDNIQLYSCIAHGKMDEFQGAELILKQHNIKDVFQIGFHLSGVVMHKFRAEAYNVTVTFDRCQITTCTCSCHPNATWCAHIIAICLFRIRFPELICFRPPISESLSRLQRDQLQKFTQYLINELPPQVLPTAQRLLDELLSFPSSKMNELHGAPDPTAGAGYVDKPKWLLDVETLHENIRKILSKFCGPSPVAFVGYNSTYFTSSAPATHTEWLNLLRPLIYHEPEGLWNLLDIVKNLFKVRDVNSSEILQIITEECLSFHQLSLWWFLNAIEGCSVKLNLNLLSSNVSTSEFARNTGARLLDECVDLWKVTLLAPNVSEDDRQNMITKLEAWHESVLEKAKKAFVGQNDVLSDAMKKFKGFKPALDVASREWKPIFVNFGIDPDNFDVLDSRNSLIRELSKENEEKPNTSNTTDSLKDIEDLFICVHALNTFGFSSAKSLAVVLAKKLLSLSSRSYDHFSVVIKSSYICKALKDTTDCQHLPFKLALFGLAFPRKPAATKSEEVRLAYCEVNLRTALKMMTVGPKEVDLIKSRIHDVLFACTTKEPQSKPLVFSIYAFEVLSDAAVQSGVLKEFENKYSADFSLTQKDKELSYKFAIASLEWSCHGNEHQHLMLCESMRRFRCDLAMTLLWHFRSDVTKLNEILSVVLRENNSILNEAEVETGSSSSGSVEERIVNKGFNVGLTKEIIDQCCNPKMQPRIIAANSGSENGTNNSTWNATQRDSLEDWDAEITAENHIENAASESTSLPIAVYRASEDVLRFDSLSLEPDTNEYGMNQLEGMTGQPVEGSPNKIVSKSIDCDSEDNSYSQDSAKGSLERDSDDDRGSGPPNESAINRDAVQKQRSLAAEDNRTDEENVSATPWYIDGKNSWDPALSWAERCESQDNEFSSECHKGSKNESSLGDARTTVDNFQLECDAYALFELAKEVLLRTIDQADCNAAFEARKNDDLEPCKNLQLIAFEIAVHSLGLQNRVSPKWLSRTYSPQVTWIADKSIDIGCPALQILNEKWENVLTPSEVIDIASRATRFGNSLIKRTAAELAVSCLPLAHTLNPGEIQLSVDLCKEQDMRLLERACVSVEIASRKGGIQPEMLFFIAKQWQHIHEKEKDGKSTNKNDKEKFTKAGKNNNAAFCDSVTVSGACRFGSKADSSVSGSGGTRMPVPNSGPCFVSSSLAPRFVQEPASANGTFCHPTVLTPEQYVQQQMHRMAQEMLNRNYSKQDDTKPKFIEESTGRIHSQFYGGAQHACTASRRIVRSKCSPQSSGSNIAPQTKYSKNLQSNDAPPKLHNAFCIGMKALEALARRSIDDRPEIKFAPSPPCSDDIRWLCALAASLGPQYLRNFCNNVTSSVSSPYVLHDLALEAARHFAIYNPAQLASHLQSPSVSPIVHKCLNMYTELVRRDLVLLTQASYPDFIELLRRVRSAFCMAPGGMTKFNELLEMIRKSCPKRRDFWQHLMNGLSRA